MKSAVKRVEIPILQPSGCTFAAYPTPSSSVNFAVRDGCLSDAVGFMPATLTDTALSVSLPDTFTAKHIYSAITAGGERLIVCGVSHEGVGVVYAFSAESPTDGFVLLEGADCEDACFAAVRRLGVAGIAFTPGDGRLFFYDGTSLSTGSCPSGTLDLCQFRDRLVSLTVDRLYVSSGDPLVFDSTDGSVFDLPEGIYGKRCAVFDNELIVVGTRGVARLTVIDFGRTFYLRPVCTGVERLFPETLATCGHGVYLLSENGLVVFEGVELVYSSKSSVDGVTDGIGGFFSGGDYHAIVKTADNAQKRRVLSYTDEGVFSSDTRVISCTGWDHGRRTVALIEDKHGVFEVGNGYISPAPVRRYKTCTCDFGRSGQKVVSAFSVRTERDMLVRITADGIPHTFAVRGGRGERTVCPYLTGKEFSFEIIYEGIGAEISHPAVTVEYLKEGL